MMEKKFKILGLQQIAIGGLSIDRHLILWKTLLGLSEMGTYKNETENVIEVILKLGEGTQSVELDIMQPMDPNKKPSVHIPPLNHIGLWVDNLASAVEYLESKGVRFAPGGIRKGAAGYDIVFIHPRGNDTFPVSGEGVLIELVQAPEELAGKS
jgi:lactoylglutathione lyase